MVLFRDVFLLPLDPHAQLSFRLPLQVYRHELLQEQRLEPTHLSVVRWLVVRSSYLDRLVLPVLRACVSRLKAYNQFVGSTLERHINSRCKIVIRPTIMATNPFEPVYLLNCVFLWRAPELFRLLVVEHWAFRHVFLLFQNGSHSSSRSSRDCRLGDPPTLNPLRPCLTVTASCGVLNALGRRPSRRLLLSKPTPRSSSPLTSDGCSLSVPDDRLMTPVRLPPTPTPATPLGFRSPTPAFRANLGRTTSSAARRSFPGHWRLAPTYKRLAVVELCLTRARSLITIDDPHFLSLLVTHPATDSYAPSVTAPPASGFRESLQLCASLNSSPCGSESDWNCDESGTSRSRETSLANHVPFCPKVRSLTSPGGPLERPFDRAEAALAACNPVEDRARCVTALKPE
ncbi:hypothetical protein OUZ56_030063 [Daphnia magna]|uniref:Uncharacterized protein n=1 Tax=Daphnia magna TaxID=35525 RepID=A0ABQ9ZQ72_9CRUS|nr:hypothetical protein OUZ56_030063 [Daphnia magna]